MVTNQKNITTNTYDQINLTSLKSSYWNLIALKYKKIVRIPAVNHGANWVDFARLAADHGLETNFIFLARVDTEKLKNLNYSLLHKVRNGNFDRDTIYIFDKQYLIQILSSKTPEDLIAKIDDYYILLPGWKKYPTCSQIDTKNIISPSWIQINSDSNIDFSNKNSDAKSTFYLGSGWSWTEDWGTWSDGEFAILNLPISKNKPKNLTLNFKTFVVTKAHPHQIVAISINGVFYQEFNFKQFEGNQIIIALSPDMLVRDYLEIEFSFKNPGRPKDLVDNNKDNRQLGIGLVSVKFGF